MKGRIIGHGEKTRYLIDGLEVSRAEFDAAFPDKPIGDGSGLLGQMRPRASDALAVHCDQVPEAVESARRKGVPTEFLRDGRPIIRSRAHQKAYLKAYGFYNRDGGYGD